MAMTPANAQGVQLQARETEETCIDLKTPIRELSDGLLEAAGHLMTCAATHRDWKKFAFLVKFREQDVARFAMAKDPAFEVITNWSTKREATVGRFTEILHEMDRADVITELKKAFAGKMSSCLDNRINKLLNQTEGYSMY